MHPQDAHTIQARKANRARLRKAIQAATAERKRAFTAWGKAPSAFGLHRWRAAEAREENLRAELAEAWGDHDSDPWWDDAASPASPGQP